MIKEITKYIKSGGRRYADCTYYEIHFDDDQEYYRVVSHLCDTLGRAPSKDRLRPSWIHDPERFRISFRSMYLLVDFLKEYYDYKSVVVAGSFDPHYIRAWALPRGYATYGTWNYIEFITPSEKDHLLCKLRWEGQHNEESTPW